MNMVNFLDGLDGLAAGVCGIAGGTFAMISLSLSKPSAAAFSAIILGACLGFLRHNFFPARIFMGDSGAMLLGFSLAAVSVEGLLKTAATVALFFPLLVLAVPILDTGFVVARRLKYRMPITAPDKAHLHHRFVDIGFSQRRAVFYIYFWVATLAAAALGTRFIRSVRTAAGTRGRRSARSRSACSPSERRCTWSTCSRSSSWRTRASAAGAARPRSGLGEAPDRQGERLRPYEPSRFHPQHHRQPHAGSSGRDSAGADRRTGPVARRGADRARADPGCTGDLDGGHVGVERLPECERCARADTTGRRGLQGEARRHLPGEHAERTELLAAGAARADRLHRRHVDVAAVGADRQRSGARQNLPGRAARAGLGVADAGRVVGQLTEPPVSPPRECEDGVAERRRRVDVRAVRADGEVGHPVQADPGRHRGERREAPVLTLRRNTRIAPGE